MKSKGEINTAIIRGKTKWTEIYDSEEELIADLLKSEDYEQRYTSGYEYLKSFKKQVKAGRKLSEKQMIMLKRLAKEVYKNVHWNNVYWNLTQEV